MDENDTSRSYHFQVMRRAIDIIDAAPPPGPSLEALAAELNMSAGHFQRIFSAWAGVSPKRFQQYLMLGHAKALLAEKHTVLDTAAETGLSGGGRLHDLFIRWEAMSPGDYARAGEGLTIRQGWFDTPFGDTLVMATDRGICGIAFASETGREAAVDDLRRRWPGADYAEDAGALRPFVDPVLGGGGETQLHLIGAPFQIKVWEALLAIPSGHVTTYSDIARVVGKPRAVRAVGTAVGRNPVSWLIPCHRALRKTGALGGYHWGLPVKRALLAWESAAEEAGAA
ncbi:methylated-DNA--[protein]-cysteine S-methyltransferase [Rhodobacterales bacterium HKCCE2091]|nr:methylated-DNA--[protein]-cysteine S-methyltransferase [Rhodobacterales bacterium HKCCE2091]